jgi:hypothetical protein
MKKNVGNVDVVLRIFLGIVIAAVGFYYRSWLGLIAIIPIATAWFGFCPLYAILGFNTCKTKINAK